MASTSPAPSAAVDALLLLAKGFVARDQPVLAIKCYLAIRSSKHELPAVEAFANVQLGWLLLDHTHNVSEAQQAMSKAVSSSLLSAPAQPLCLLVLERMHQPASTLKPIWNI